MYADDIVIVNVTVKSNWKKLKQKYVENDLRIINDWMEKFYQLSILPSTIVDLLNS